MTLESSDPSREYTEEEQRTLANNLAQISGAIHRGELLNERPALDLLCRIHRSLFNGVRGHAGCIRRSGFGSETLHFGPHKSSDSRDVPNQLIDLFTELQKAIASFDENPTAPNYEHSAIHLAVWVHARVIRIHPFEDGNGRSSRALLNWVLIRLGLRPVAFNVVRQDYLACLNHYYNTDDIQPLIDLCISVYPTSGNA